MVDWCRVSATNAAEADRCPANGARGTPVELLTVKALLTDAALAHFNNVAHRFCSGPACDVVYFDADGRTYGTRDLRVPVWQKEPFGERLICYCFGISEGGIRDEIQATGRSGAVHRVRAHIAAGRCACDVRNPRGACCLGDIVAAVERVTADLRARDPERRDV